MSISLPTVVDTSASLDVSTNNGLLAQPFSRSKTVIGYSSLYVEPINLGWHWPLFDSVAAVGFFAPAGGYNPKKLVNTALGRWAEMFSLGSTGYFSPDREWSVALEGRFPIHQPQQGIDLRAGDDFAVEGGVGRKFTTEIGTVTVGFAGYAYWQATALSGSAVPAPGQIAVAPHPRTVPRREGGGCYTRAGAGSSRARSRLAKRLRAADREPVPYHRSWSPRRPVADRYGARGLAE
jgi:hypothetical protein